MSEISVVTKVISIPSAPNTLHLCNTFITENISQESSTNLFLLNVSLKWFEQSYFSCNFTQFHTVQQNLNILFSLLIFSLKWFEQSYFSCNFTQFHTVQQNLNILFSLLIFFSRSLNQVLPMLPTKQFP